MRRSLIVAACAAGLLGLAGCKGSVPTPERSPTPSPSPSATADQTRQVTERLSAAVRKLAATSFRFEGGSGIVRIDGTFDPRKHRGEATGSFGVGSGDIRIIGSELYVKGLADKPDDWLRVRTGRLAPGNALAQIADPTVITGYLTAIGTATQSGPGRYSGTIDLAALTRRAATSTRYEGLLTLLGANPSAATFEARTDSAGRLTDLSVTVPESSGTVGTTLTTRYSDFGVAVDVARPPAARVEEAPDQLYALLAPTASASPSSTP